MARLLSNKQKLTSFLKVTGVSAFLFTGISVHQNNAQIYEYLVIPIGHLLNPETAHNLAVKALKWGVIGKSNKQDDPELETNVWGLKFKNPLGMAAGFDKQAEAVKGLHDVGFSFVEIGSITPRPQIGNPKPRVFRLTEDKAVVNRYGFNSDGHDVVSKRLETYKASEKSLGIVGVNLGKNKTSEDATQDYVDGIKRFSNVADYFVINISSPNTPGLRDLQSKEKLRKLLIKVNQARESIGSNKPLLLKLAPDLSESERQDVADVILDKNSKVDGLILCNTTISRPNLKSKNQTESGGLSGAPLTDLSTAMISDMYERTKGTVPIIGVGGIFSGRDAYEKIKAGASLVQIYTSYIYHGPPVVSRIKGELVELLKQNGFPSVRDAVGKSTSIK